jgi:succinyl-diaminopimelate desuccinylase
MINKKRLVRLTQDLLRINSENPPGDERKIASFVAAYLRKIGLRPKILAFHPKRDNVLAVLSSRRKGGTKKPLLITPHLDTVPAGQGWSFRPFSGTCHHKRIYGRGATDCKGNLAVALETIHSLLEDKIALNHDVIFLGSADEETGSTQGLVPFLEKNLLKPSFALIFDSDEFNIIVAQKGLIHFKVEVRGRKAHGAYPERGVNAIDGALKLIEVLKKIHLQYRRHQLLKPPTTNIGTIRGGDKVNMVPDACDFEVDLRFLPGMDAGNILSQIRKAFDQTHVRYEIRVNDIQKPYEIDRRHPLVESLKEAARGIVQNSGVKGSEGATVITFFKRKNIPAVATGYGSAGCAHATDEYAKIENLYKGAIVLERFIKIFDARI